MDPLSAAITRFGILLVISPAFALLLRASGLPGKSPASVIVGGVLAGLLAGPLVFGSLRPGLFESIHIGGGEARAELAELDRLHEFDLVAMRGASPVAIEEQQRAQALEREPVRKAADEAMVRHREPARLFGVVLVGVSFFLAATLARRRVPRSTDQGEIQPAIGAGLLIALVTTLGTGVLVSWLLKLDRPTAILIGAATAAGSAFTHLPMRWVGCEGRRIAANAINVFAFLASMMVLILMTEGNRVAIMAPVGGVFFGGLLRGRVRSTRARRRVARGLVLWLFGAPLTAYLVSEIDPRLVLDSWRTMTFVVLAVGLAGMGHFLGAGLGLKMFGTARQRSNATSIWIESHALGVSLTQIMLLVVLVGAGVIDGREPAGASVIGGIVLGICFIEMTIGLLRRMMGVDDRTPA